MSQTSLSQFHPLVAKWFADAIGEPTDVQTQAWPKIAEGEHVLITAPTGSGKTLTAFLWAINQLVTEELPIGHTSVLYVSPLKALNNDIRRNLLEPLRGLRQVFEEAKHPFPTIRVLTRSGDTPHSDRRQMQRHPPEILITTPESLNLLLSSGGGRSILTRISTVILDEIHAVVGTKRGTHLITAVERLVRLSGEFQRIALSATIRPMETVAEFVGSYKAEGNLHNPTYTPRPVTTISSKSDKQYEVQVRYPDEAAEDPGRESFWDPLVDEFRAIIFKNQSTLIFANSRRLCERLTLMINADEELPIAYAHHGSLSREIRESVEAKLKAGELKAIVATSSLEMGIDIGALDNIVLIQSPFSISSAIQRIGRAGHQVGEVSRATVFPTHSRDFLDAAVLAEAIGAQAIEPIKPVKCPLDVLSQIIVSMAAMETWDIDELYVHLKASYPYRHLGREQFDQVLNMLAGRYADSRIRELKPRVSIDRLDNTVFSRKGAIQAVYLCGGTIPDRGYFHMRHAETNARIGELDEEFVWENGEGSVFTLGTQTWRVERVTHSDVFVLPNRSAQKDTPFWRAEDHGRDFHFSERVGLFLEEANRRLDDPEYLDHLQRVNCMEGSAAAQLVDFFKRQKDATDCDLPHRRHLLIEIVQTGHEGVPGNQVVIHTFWGAKVNRPYGVALASAWADRFGYQLEVHATDDSIVLMLPDELPPAELLSMVTSATLQPLLRRHLEGSGFFCARFRECAGTSLLLTSGGKMNQRMPLWLSRLRSQKLMTAVMKYEDFPILLETWRTCLQDEFDLDSLQQMLAELESGAIRWTAVHTAYASPMAQNASWRQINEYMYMGDYSTATTTSMLRNDLLRDVVFTPGLRPTVSQTLIRQFEQKRQRLSPGYSPQTPTELIDWAKERLLIPAPEWEALLDAIRRDHGLEPDDILSPITDKLVRIKPPGVSDSLIVALEMMPRIRVLYEDIETVECESLGNPKILFRLKDEDRGANISTIDDAQELTSLIGEWLQFYGPTTAEYIQRTLGIGEEKLSLVLEDLSDSQNIIIGQLVEGAVGETLCDGENFEILLRLTRRDATPSFEPLEFEWLAVFLANFQGLLTPADNLDGLQSSIEQLACYPAMAGLWESEIFPARLRAYAVSWLDSAMMEGSLKWVGGENRRVAFCFEDDLDLMEEEASANMPRRIEPGHGEESDVEERRAEIREDGELDSLFPDEAGRYDFASLLRTSGLNAARLTDRLWEFVWAGRVANDTFLALRRGILSKFKSPEIGTDKGRSRGRRLSHRAEFARWKGSSSYVGNWYRLPALDLTDDILESEERKKDRARLLLDRYGLLFRELLQRELPAFRWSNIFRSLRIMELSGEVLAGYFFYGIPGPQFISHQAFRVLSRQLPDDKVYWINAGDPVSLCGIPLDAVRGTLPKRVPSTHLVYRGRRIVMISERNGKTLKFSVPYDDPQMQEYLSVLHHLLRREFQPLHRITIETINGEDAARSPYADPLRTAFEVTIDYKHLILYRKMV